MPRQPRPARLEGRHLRASQRRLCCGNCMLRLHAPARARARDALRARARRSLARATRTERDATCRSVDLDGISGLVAEYIVAIDVTWVRSPADAFFLALHGLVFSRCTKSRPARGLRLFPRFPSDDRSRIGKPSLALHGHRPGAVAGTESGTSRTRSENHAITLKMQLPRKRASAQPRFRRAPLVAFLASGACGRGAAAPCLAGAPSN